MSRPETFSLRARLGTGRRPAVRAGNGGTGPHAWTDARAVPGGAKPTGGGGDSASDGRWAMGEGRSRHRCHCQSQRANLVLRSPGLYCRPARPRSGSTAVSHTPTSRARARRPSWVQVRKARRVHWQMDAENAVRCGGSVVRFGRVESGTRACIRGGGLQLTWAGG